MYASPSLWYFDSRLNQLRTNCQAVAENGLLGPCVFFLFQILRRVAVIVCVLFRFFIRFVFVSFLCDRK